MYHGIRLTLSSTVVHRPVIYYVTKVIFKKKKKSMTSPVPYLLHLLIYLMH